MVVASIELLNEAGTAAAIVYAHGASASGPWPPHDVPTRESVDEWLAAGNNPTPYAPPAAASMTKLYKSTVWRRATEAEAEIIDQQLSAAPARLRRLWDDSTILDHSAPEFSALAAGFVGAFGEARAAELLAPEM